VPGDAHAATAHGHGHVAGDDRPRSCERRFLRATFVAAPRHAIRRPHEDVEPAVAIDVGQPRHDRAGALLQLPPACDDGPQVVKGDRRGRRPGRDDAHVHRGRRLATHRVGDREREGIRAGEPVPGLVGERPVGIRRDAALRRLTVPLHDDRVGLDIMDAEEHARRPSRGAGLDHRAAIERPGRQVRKRVGKDGRGDARLRGQPRRDRRQAGPPRHRCEPGQSGHLDRAPKPMQERGRLMPRRRP